MRFFFATVWIAQLLLLIGIVLGVGTAANAEEATINDRD